MSGKLRQRNKEIGEPSYLRGHLGIYYPRMDHEMEEKMEKEVETKVSYGFYEVAPYQNQELHASLRLNS